MRLLLRVFLVMIVFAALMGCSKKAGIEGKVVDGTGTPMSGLKMIAEQVQPVKGYEHFETTSDLKGSFKFEGLFAASEYLITPLSDKWTANGIKAISGTEGHTAMLTKPLEIRFTRNKAGVVVDSKTGLQWVPANGQSMTYYEAESYVKNLSLDGGGWMLPSIDQLKQIHPGDPMLNVSLDHWVWSGETCNYYGAPGSRYLYFFLKTDYCYARDSSYNNLNRVLPMRYPSGHSN